MDIEKALNMAKRLALEQGRKLAAGLEHIYVAERKGPEGIDLATNADREIEQALVEKLRRAFPQTGFQVEEQRGLEKTAEYQWIIDPIDGTKYFASGVPLFCISIGLVRNGDPVLGVIYNPVSKQLYSGSLNSPAECNGRKTRILETNDLAHTMVSVDFSKNTETWPQVGVWVTEKLGLLVSRSYRVRMLGTGALSLAWVASGSVVSSFCTLAGGTKLVDVAAGLAICKAAGATVKILKSPINGEPEFIVGAERIVKDIEEIVQS
ncbi:MAG: inositol monophosphatase [Candidatus Wildermuthbacteria bacterium]|nr:inositol monophosphatase [Candidatus Wildermuthbacteria bacterium]